MSPRFTHTYSPSSSQMSGAGDDKKSQTLYHWTVFCVVTNHMCLEQKAGGVSVLDHKQPLRLEMKSTCRFAYRGAEFIKSARDEAVAYAKELLPGTEWEGFYISKIFSMGTTSPLAIVHGDAKWLCTVVYHMSDGTSKDSEKTDVMNFVIQSKLAPGSAEFYSTFLGEVIRVKRCVDRAPFITDIIIADEAL